MRRRRRAFRSSTRIGSRTYRNSISLGLIARVAWLVGFTLLGIFWVAVDGWSGDWLLGGAYLAAALSLASLGLFVPSWPDLKISLIPAALLGIASSLSMTGYGLELSDWASKTSETPDITLLLHDLSTRPGVPPAVSNRAPALMEPCGSEDLHRGSRLALEGTWQLRAPPYADLFVRMSQAKEPYVDMCLRKLIDLERICAESPAGRSLERTTSYEISQLSCLRQFSLSPTQRANAVAGDQ